MSHTLLSQMLKDKEAENEGLRALLAEVIDPHTEAIVYFVPCNAHVMDLKDRILSALEGK